MDDKEQQAEVYVTKYCLTQGVFRAQGTIDGRYFSNRGSCSFGNRLFLREGDYALTPEAAIMQCENKRKARLASLNKAVAKLTKIDFAKQMADNRDSK